MYILIGNAWAYANGSLHIGHIAALLPGDVLARYHRAKGDNVYFVSGSDCHGTPVAIRAKEEGKTPEEVSDFYHDEFCRTFGWFGFSYDKYGKTSSAEHKGVVMDFHKELYEREMERGFIYEKNSPQAYCPKCKTNLTDRFVVGKCPNCGEKARGDQCESCVSVLEPENLVSPVCAVCGETPVFNETKQIYLAVSKLEGELVAYLSEHERVWRKNAVAFTRRYINEGLRDRAITRLLDWGVDVPKEGYGDKKIYIWAENVLGYYSMSKAVAEELGEDIRCLWKNRDSKHYYVHGKDNIPFHTIILPSLLIAHGGGDELKLPDEIVSSEYLTLEGRRISTSQNHAIWAKDLAGNFDPDSLRYYFIANGPEKRDADFTMREYTFSHNAQLVGAYGNFINRSLVFVNKYFDGYIPEGELDERIEAAISSLYVNTGTNIEKTCFKDALEGIFDFVRFANKYFDTEKPWVTRADDDTKCRNTIYNCIQIIANLAVLLNPFIPFSSEKVAAWLGIDNKKWELKTVPVGHKLPEIGVLFERI